jgi:hypothetical protein
MKVSITFDFLSRIIGIYNLHAESATTEDQHDKWREHANAVYALRYDLFREQHLAERESQIEAEERNFDRQRNCFADS